MCTFFYSFYGTSLPPPIKSSISESVYELVPTSVALVLTTVLFFVGATGAEGEPLEIAKHNVQSRCQNAFVFRLAIPATKRSLKANVGSQGVLS